MEPRSFYIFVWPDNTWCYEENYNEHEYQWKSDDYRSYLLKGEWSDEEIESMLTKKEDKNV